MNLEKKENETLAEIDFEPQNDNVNQHSIFNWFLTLVLAGSIILFIFGIRHNMRQSDDLDRLSDDLDRLFKEVDTIMNVNANIARMDGYIIREKQMRNTTFKMKDSAKTDVENEALSKQFLEHYKVFDSTAESFKVSHKIPSSID